MSQAGVGAPRPVSVRRNFVVSALGDGWAVLIQIALVPVYIRLLGIEAYGLIGAVAIFYAVFVILDSAFAPAVTRSVALALSGVHRIGEARTLLRSVELLVLGVAIAVAIIALVGADWLVTRWLTRDALEASSAAAAVRILGLQLGGRLLVGIYRGVIAGAQRLVWLNGFGAFFATLRGLGVVPILWIWPGIEAYFAFQLLVTLLELFILGAKSWAILSDATRASSSAAALAGISGFSVALCAISAFTQVLYHSDRALLSITIPLAQVGLYALATSAAAGLAMIAGPFYWVALPRLTELSSRDAPELAEGFRELSRMAALALAPAGWVLVLFAEPVLFVWTGDRQLSSAASPFLATLAVAGLIRSGTTIPIQLQLAVGKAKTVAVWYGAMVVVFVPSAYFGSMTHGAMAAAYSWVAVSALALALMMPMVSESLSAAQARTWLAWDVALPIAAAGLGAWVVRSTVQPGDSAWAMAAHAVAAYLASLAFTAIAVSRRLRFRPTSVRS